jgi:hypothetical protein
MGKHHTIWDLGSISFSVWDQEIWGVKMIQNFEKTSGQI